MILVDRQQKHNRNAGQKVNNGKQPGLTHLLENGHMIVNKKGSYGRTSGIKHIAPVNDEEQDTFLNATLAALDKEL